MIRAIVAAFVLAPSLAFAEEMTIWREADTDALAVVQNTCADHQANAEAIAAELTGRGWRQITDAERRQRDPQNVGGGFTMHWQSSQAWVPQDDASLTLVLGEGPVGQGEARADFCMVVEQAAFSQQVRTVRRWLGFERFQTWGPGGDIFAYMRDAEGHFTNGANVPDADRNAALREGRYGFIQVVGDRATSVVNYSVLHPLGPLPG